MALIGLGTALGACGGDGGGGAVDGAALEPDAQAPLVDAAGLVGARPYVSEAPSDLTPGEALPLVLLLHGYSATGRVQANYLGLLAAVDTHRFLLAYPDGTMDGLGNKFWAATDACCGAGVDDVAYLGAVLDDMIARHDVDLDRVYVIGHSNGGFMAHRLACELAPRIAAIASLAGTTWNDPTRCAPSEPVSVLQLHGDADRTILYGGGEILGAAYPGAERAVEIWADKNACGGGLAPAGGDFELDATVAGAETSPLSHAPCPDGGAVELWRMRGSGHLPNVATQFADVVIPWLYAHPKP